MAWFTRRRAQRVYVVQPQCFDVRTKVGLDLIATVLTRHAGGPVYSVPSTDASEWFPHALSDAIGAGACLCVVCEATSAAALCEQMMCGGPRDASVPVHVVTTRLGAGHDGRDGRAYDRYPTLGITGLYSGEGLRGLSHVRVAMWARVLRADPPLGYRDLVDWAGVAAAVRTRTLRATMSTLDECLPPGAYATFGPPYERASRALIVDTAALRGRALLEVFAAAHTLRLRGRLVVVPNLGGFARVTGVPSSAADLLVAPRLDAMVRGVDVEAGIPVEIVSPAKLSGI